MKDDSLKNNELEQESNEQQDITENSVPTRHPIERVISGFVHNIERLASCLPITIETISKKHELDIKNWERFIDKYAEDRKVENDIEMIKFPPHMARTVSRKYKSVGALYGATDVILQSFLVSLVSQYDAYLGKLVKELYSIKPDILNSSERKLTYENLISFNNIESARDYIVEKEIDTLLRKSHHEQIKSLERTFKINLTKKLEVYKCFVEITQRRNLFVHCDGIVSNQYISECSLHSVNNISGVSIGEKLHADPEYFHEAYRCLFEMGVKLGQVLWRKLCPDEIEIADNCLVNTTYDLLENEKYKLAITFGDFACNVLPKLGSTETKLVCVINHALALRYSGKKKESLETVDKIDWSAYANEYKIANHVIREEYEQAVEIMKRVGATDEMKQAYHAWPLFKDFKLEKRFAETYKDIFNEEFFEITSGTES